MPPFYSTPFSPGFCLLFFFVSHFMDAKTGVAKEIGFRVGWVRNSNSLELDLEKDVSHQRSGLDGSRPFGVLGRPETGVRQFFAAPGGLHAFPDGHGFGPPGVGRFGLRVHPSMEGRERRPRDLG